MADETHLDDHGAHESGEHIHLPPNSWSPISLSLALTMLFVGFLARLWVVIVGAVWVVLSIAAWVKAARTEYLELPEEASH